jgi:hypothetical protein
METPARRRRSAFRFSLKALLLFVVPISAGLAALRDATDAWLSGTVTFTLSAIFVAILATIYSSPLRRPVFGAFAICCGIYFFLVLFSDESGIVSAFATSKLNGYLLEKLHPGVPGPSGLISKIPVVGRAVQSETSEKWFRTRLESNRRTPTVATSDLGLLPVAVLIGMVDANGSDSQTREDSDASTAGGAAAKDVERPAGDSFGSFGAAGAIVFEAPEVGDNFLHIAQCLWALILGTVAAVSVRCVAPHRCLTNVSLPS